GLDWFAAFPGEFDLGDRVDISRHGLARDRCEGALIPARCADPDRKSTALLAPSEYLIDSVEECESQRAIKVNYRGVLRLVPEGLHVGGLGLVGVFDLDTDIEPLRSNGRSIRASLRLHMDYREIRVLRPPIGPSDLPGTVAPDVDVRLVRLNALSFFCQV